MNAAPMTRWAGRLVLPVTLGVFVVLAFVVLSPEAVYTPDVAVKYVQAQSLVDRDFRTLDIEYRGQVIDPDRQFLPFRPPYVMTIRGEVQAIWSASTAVFNAAFVAPFGYRGMLLASLVAAAVVLVVARRLTSGPATDAVPLILGLATPLWFFATIGWEHAPALAFVMLAWFVAARTSAPGAAALAGALLACGATLRDEVLLVSPALAAGIWLRTRHWRPVVAAGAGALGVLLAAAAMEAWWFHRPFGAHALYTAHLLRSLFSAADAAPPGVEPLTPYTFQDRYGTVVQYWLLGYYDNLWLAIVAGGLALAFWWWKRQGGAAWPAVAAVGVLVALAAVDTVALLRAPKWIAGLYRLAPFLVFAVLPTPGGRMPWIRKVAVIAAASYLGLAMLATDLAGGKGFPRLLLPILPLLVVSAAMAIASFLRAPRADERWVGRLGAGLVVLSLAIHAGSTIPAYAWRSAEDGAIVRFLQQSEETVVVADDITTAHLLLPIYADKILLLADSQPLTDRLAEALTEWRVPAVLVVSRGPSPAFTLPGFQAAVPVREGRMTVSVWRR